MPERGKLSLIAEYEASQEMASALDLLRRSDATLGGFAGASLAWFLAAWRSPSAGRVGGPLLVVTATQEEADELVEELESFASVTIRSFPAWESLFLPESVPDGEIYGQRLEVLKRLCGVGPKDEIIVAPVQAVLQPVPEGSALREALISVRSGSSLPPQSLAETLARKGLRHAPLVETRGEFSWRGDILDVFPFDAAHPIRVEFFGDSVESLRAFHPETQRSLEGADLGEVELCLPRREQFFLPCLTGEETIVPDLLGDSGRVVVLDFTRVQERAERILANLVPDPEVVLPAFLKRLGSPSLLRACSLPETESEASLNLGFRSVERFRCADLDQIFDAVRAHLERGHRFEVYCESPAEGKRFREILGDHQLSETPALRVRVGSVRRGFEASALSTIFLTTREIFQRHIVRRVRRKVAPSYAIQGFYELKKGDVVVHLVHGVGRYVGIESFERNGVFEEFLAIEYRDKVKVYVPVSKIDLVQKYIGSGDRPVVLDKVGGASWSRKKEDVQRALFDLASELVDIQAVRQERPGFAFPEASEWQREFEAAFPFEETPDQVDTTASIHEDMESPRPMDRLICGDVGYGKTELAMRATFKAVDAGKQVAVLVPTTVLAQQHYRTFSERMSGFPITVDVLSRFRTSSEQRKTIEALKAGQVDVVIGTHRLLSRDVEFRDLGLVIIDEEQRFGVAHKERLKRIRSTVDVLTLTATPIPRTLHMALLGIRDISSLTTAPEGRCPVRTEIAQFEPSLIREIMIRELNRDGQMYFVHNRIEDMPLVVSRLQEIVPDARIEYAHGQMNEHELEEIMFRFFEGGIDCLVCTTIIENGLDIPNVNTIFIDEADRYGLADLHQLRGRVGRYKHQAYCYLILPGERAVNPEAQRRLQALVEFSDLGAGFQIALRDLEIRGAGNILGPEQSGHIAAVGYDMYCRLLEKAVRTLRNEEVQETTPVDVEIDLAVDAKIPEEYRAGEAAKIALYRRIATTDGVEAVEELADELRDRFGPVPPQVARLLDVQKLRLLCAARGVQYVGREENSLILRGSESMRDLLDGVQRRLAILDSRTVGIPLIDPARRYAPRLSDERVFRIVLRWLETGELSTTVAGQSPLTAGKAGGISTPRR